MNIILGVFYTPYWDEVKDLTNSYEFEEFIELPNYEADCSKESFVEIYIIPACNLFEKVNFMLDRIFLPLSEASLTCKELNYVISDTETLAKTQFWLKGEKVDTENVLKIIQSVKDNELRFDNLDIKTF